MDAIEIPVIIPQTPADVAQLDRLYEAGELAWSGNEGVIGEEDEPRTAALHPESAIHLAADQYLGQVRTTVEFAFAVGRKVLRGSLRTAGDLPGHPFHGNQWTEGGGGDFKPAPRTDSFKSMPQDEGYGRTENASHINRKLIDGRELSAEQQSMVRAVEHSMAKNITEDNYEVFHSGQIPTDKTTDSPAFLSTSTDQRAAATFGGKMTVIQVPKGTHFAPGSWSEQEMILPRGGRLEPAGKTKDGIPILRYHEHPTTHERLSRMERARKLRDDREMARYAASAPNISACISAIQKSLEATLPPVLARVYAAGGNVGFEGLRKLKALGDLPGHEFHGNQWTSGDGWEDGGIHGTDAGAAIERDGFSLGTAGKQSGSKGLIGTGIYLDTSADKGIAPLYGKTILSVQIKQGLKFLDVADVRSLYTKETAYGDSDKITSMLRAQGYDGVRAGDQAVVFDPANVRVHKLRTLKPKPFDNRRTFPAKAGAFSMRFDVKSPRAIKWAKEHAAELVKELSETSEKRIKAAVAGALEGDGLDAAYDTILKAVGDEARADMIARTETMTAANEGQRGSWDEAVERGLLPPDVKVSWIATEPFACPECEALDREERTLDGEYPDPGGAGPPLHPNCRCTEGITG